MYCTQCGKQIDYEATMCDECLGKSIRNRENANANVEAQYHTAESTTNVHIVPPQHSNANPTVEKNRMYKFAHSLTAAILSINAYLICVILMSTEVYDAMVVGAIFGLGLSIAGLVNGIVALKNVVRYKRENDITPIAPLVLSIVGTAIGGLMLLVSFLAFITYMSY